MHKFYIIVFGLLISSIGFSQETGTLKMSKDLPKQKTHRGYFVSSSTTFAGKSSPKKFRDSEFLIGTNLGYHKNQYSRFLAGVVSGYSHPKENHKGIAMGAFVESNYHLMLGPTSVLLPRIQISYKRIFNRNTEYENWNQYSAGLGFSVYIPYRDIRGFQFTFMGHYRNDQGSGINQKGIFPSLGMAMFF